MKLFTQIQLGEVISKPILYWEENLDQLQKNKREIIENLLWKSFHIARPNPDEIDIWNIDSIFQFIAKENLECAFFCDPNTKEWTVENLWNIIAWNIPLWKYIHISLHSNYSHAKNINKKPYNYLFAYFEVMLHDFAQTESERMNYINEFIFVYQSHKAWSSNQ